MENKNIEATAIAEITKNGEFKLNTTKLAVVLHKVKCKDLAIVSMAGASRTGKSFMLNFFIRYLRQKGWKNDNWFGKDDTKIQDAFQWQRGSDPHTRGIYVWPEIFYVEKNGKQVGVLIVDTQGLFDLTSSPDINVKIMSVSTFLSSHQILNFKNNLRITDFEHLQFSVNYAQTASQSDPEMRTPFQKLTFLIRDWSNAHEHSYGDGGNAYIKKILETSYPSLPESVKEVKQSIHDAFEDVKGFLMPRPSNNIDGGAEVSSICNADIKGDFRVYLMKLVHTVLHPDNLVEKRMSGQPVTADGLLNLIGEFSKCIESDKQPKVETLLQSSTKANNVTALYEAVSEYKRCFEELVKSSVLADDKLNEYHQKALKKARDEFEKRATLGPEEQRKEVWKKAEEDCQFYFDQEKNGNGLRKSKKIQQMHKIRLELQKEFKSKIDIMEKDVSLEMFDARYKVYLNEAVKKYMLEMNQFEAVLNDDMEAIKEQLQIEMDRFFQQSRQHLETLEQRRRLAKEKELLKIQETFSDYKSKFQRDFTLGPEMSELTVAEKCARAMQQIMRNYEDSCRAYTDQEQVQLWREKLQKCLKEHCEYVKEGREKERVKYERRYQTYALKYKVNMKRREMHIKSVVEDYEASMREWLHRLRPAPKVLKIRHNRMLEDAVEKFGNRMGSRRGPDDIRQLKEAINQVYLRLASENEVARDKVELQKKRKEVSLQNLDVIKKTRRDEFNDEITSCKDLNELTSDELQKMVTKHMCKFDAETEHLPKDISNEIKTARIDLAKTLDKIVEKTLLENKENEKRLSDEIEDAINGCMISYRDALNELVQTSYVTPDGFEKMEEEYFKAFASGKENEEFRKLIREAIEQETSKARKRNEGNKEYRSVEADEFTVAEYIATGAIVITVPVWLPLGLIAGLGYGVVVGIKKLANLIARKVKERK